MPSQIPAEFLSTVDKKRVRYEPMGSLCLRLLTSAIKDLIDEQGSVRRKAFFWIRGADASITVEYACDYLGISYTFLLRIVQRALEYQDSLLKVRLLSHPECRKSLLRVRLLSHPECREELPMKISQQDLPIFQFQVSPDEPWQDVPYLPTIQPDHDEPMTKTEEKQFLGH